MLDHLNVGQKAIAIAGAILVAICIGYGFYANEWIYAIIMGVAYGAVIAIEVILYENRKKSK